MALFSLHCADCWSAIKKCSLTHSFTSESRLTISYTVQHTWYLPIGFI